MKNNHILKLFLAIFTIINFNTSFGANNDLGAATKQLEALSKSVGLSELVLKVIITTHAAKPIVEMIKINDTDKISKIKKEIIKRHPNFKNFKLVLRAFNENVKILSNEDEKLPIFRFISLNNPIIQVNLEQLEHFFAPFNLIEKPQQAQK